MRRYNTGEVEAPLTTVEEAESTVERSGYTWCVVYPEGFGTCGGYGRATYVPGVGWYQ